LLGDCGSDNVSPVLPIDSIVILIHHLILLFNVTCIYYDIGQLLYSQQEKRENKSILMKLVTCPAEKNNTIRYQLIRFDE